MSYDSTQGTMTHIRRVQELMSDVLTRLAERARVHDASKLEEPEKSDFDAVGHRLYDTTYDSEEYKANLAQLERALNHHYKMNSHHPEHTEYGIDGMSLLDILEMFVDWRAAVEKHHDGSFSRSLEINHDRFGVSDQLHNIFLNTKEELGW